MILKLKVAILGGAMNPITIGHVKLAHFVLDKGGFAQIWITPCYQHRYGKEMVSPEHRLKMCKMARKEWRVSVFDYEIKNKMKDGTYSFFKKLTQDEKFRDIEFYCIIGSDNANTFDQWKDYKDLLQTVKFVVVVRKGITLEKKAEEWFRDHIILDPENFGDEIPSTASSRVRDALKVIYNKENREKIEAAKNIIDAQLDEDVKKYILKEGLYKK